MLSLRHLLINEKKVIGNPIEYYCIFEKALKIYSLLSFICEALINKVSHFFSQFHWKKTLLSIYLRIFRKKIILFLISAILEQKYD